MPILPAEAEFYPPDLWSAYQGSPKPGRWWCLHVKPRQEKSVARHLLFRRITYYLPQALRETRSPSGKRLRSRIPLFPGYLFLHGSEDDRYEALQSDRLVRVLEVPSQAELVRDLGQIQRVSASGVPFLPEPVFAVGRRVRILNGPLSGLVGTVDRRGGDQRFTAVVCFLGQGVSVELADWQVESIGAA